MNKKILLLLMLLPLVTSAQTSRTIHVATAGTLSDYISEDEKYQIEELTLSGELNGTDIRFIRNMSGIDYEERYMDVSDPYEDINTAGKLKTLDISNVKIVGGEVYYCCTTGTARYKCYSSVDDVISTYMFRGCKLTSIIMPNSVTSIEGSAFADCSRLTSVTIPNSVMSIGSGAFWGCSSLTSITIPNSVTSVGYQAFWGCSSLTSITIPNSVTSIEDWAFSGCSGLTSIKVESGNNIYDSRNNCNAIIEKSSNTLITGCKNTIIPNSVTSIGTGAFYDCSGLTTITIPNSVTSIGFDAFEGCI